MTQLEDYELEKEALFDKTFTCPVCGETVKAKTLKTGKSKLESTDSDLRPKYANIDSLKYDAVLCEHCGYAALRRFFPEPLVSVQIEHVKDKVTNNYREKHIECEIFTYEESIKRHKLALISAMAKDCAISEIGYTCLKIAWLYRGSQELIQKNGDASETSQDSLVEFKAQETHYIKNAYKCFKEAYLNEEFPICGMDEVTISYLIADLAYKEEDYQECNRSLSRVITSRAASERVKEKARDLKELVKHKVTE